jgi:hypothetical protein
MPIPNTAQGTVDFRSVHRALATIMIFFAAAHMANHLAGLASASSHIALMDRLRVVYRAPAIEVGLLACVAMHALSGLVLLRRGWNSRSGAIAWLQGASGGYLGIFLLIHVAAVLYGRWVLGIDTNFYLAAAGLHVSPARYFFGPYYFFAVISLFVHIGCALSRHIGRSSPSRGIIVAAFTGAGAVASVLVVASLMGAIHAYTVPQRYLATF